jgi:hypothetical protein
MLMVRAYVAVLVGANWRVDLVMILMFNIRIHHLMMHHTSNSSWTTFVRAAKRSSSGSNGLIITDADFSTTQKCYKNKIE